MTEEQRKELDALAHSFQYKKIVRYVERLELGARLDEIQKCWDTWKTPPPSLGWGW